MRSRINTIMNTQLCVFVSDNLYLQCVSCRHGYNGPIELSSTVVMFSDNNLRTVHFTPSLYIPTHKFKRKERGWKMEKRERMKEEISNV